MATLQELLLDEIRDLYDAEKQLTKALPKLARVATTPELKQAFLEHTEVTKTQSQRLEQIFELMGQRAKSKPCKAMKGLVEEANEHITEHERGNELDAVLVASAQRVEHYEIAGYGTARAYAKSMGKRDAMQLLDATLKEEGDTDKLLSKIGLQIQKELLREEGESEAAADEQMGKYERRGARKAAGSAPAKKKVAAQGGRGSSKRGGNGGGSKAGSKVTTDHEEIRQWAEARGANPACVRGTGSKGDTGMIRLDFPGFSGAGSLEGISWDDWFQKFDEQNLALLYQESTARGQRSNFNKLIARETAELAARGGRGSARRGGGGRKTARGR